MDAAENSDFTYELGRECNILALSHKLFSETACMGTNLSACRQLSSWIVYRDTGYDRALHSPRGHNHGYTIETVVAQTSMEIVPECAPTDWWVIQLAGYV